MTRQKYLLWTLYQDLYKKNMEEEIDQVYLDYVRNELFSADPAEVEEIEDPEEDMEISLDDLK